MVAGWFTARRSCLTKNLHQTFASDQCFWASEGKTAHERMGAAAEPNTESEQSVLRPLQPWDQGFLVDRISGVQVIGIQPSYFPIRLQAFPERDCATQGRVLRTPHWSTSTRGSRIEWRAIVGAGAHGRGRHGFWGQAVCTGPQAATSCITGPNIL